ncbi:MAG: hypothetical protein P4L10_17490 [Acidobacteriaceae bacterium]|nr:hypothetical protein [Acidobacteriaceae bacterium]
MPTLLKSSGLVNGSSTDYATDKHRTRWYFSQLSDLLVQSAHIIERDAGTAL